MEDMLEIDRKRLLELGKIKGQNILDIGAGELALIAAGDFECTVTSIEVSEDLLEEERERVRREGLDGKIKLEKEDATDLSYENGRFDTVISYGALHHNPVEKREKFVEEAVRVAKENVLIIDFKEEHHIHPEDVHPPVDHGWLSEVLEKYGSVERYEGKEKLLYVLRKEG